MLELLYIPGVFIGIPLFDNLCMLGGIKDLCVRDFGSGTSTGERVFVKIGLVLFYIPLILYIIKKYFSKIKFLDCIKFRLILLIYILNLFLWVFLAIILPIFAN